MADRQSDERKLQEKKIVCWASPGCVHQCGLIATVEDGTLVRLRGNPDYPTPNHGCSDRMPHHIKWLYSPEQLLHPLKRVGERGDPVAGQNARSAGSGPHRREAEGAFQLSLTSAP
jgi:anaerobic selenocysteine-containing dehydrogenase